MRTLPPPLLPPQHIHTNKHGALSTSANLLDLGRGALEQLDVAGAHGLAVLLEGLEGLLLVGEQHEGVARRPAVRVVHEEDAVLPIQYLTPVGVAREELQLAGGGGQETKGEARVVRKYPTGRERILCDPQL